MSSDNTIENISITFLPYEYITERGKESCRSFLKTLLKTELVSKDDADAIKVYLAKGSSYKYYHKFSYGINIVYKDFMRKIGSDELKKMLFSVLPTCHCLKITGAPKVVLRKIIDIISKSMKFDDVKWGEIYVALSISKHSLSIEQISNHTGISKRVVINKLEEFNSEIREALFLDEFGNNYYTLQNKRESFKDKIREILFILRF